MNFRRSCTSASLRIEAHQDQGCHLKEIVAASLFLWSACHLCKDARPVMVSDDFFLQFCTQEQPQLSKMFCACEEERSCSGPCHRVVCRASAHVAVKDGCLYYGVAR